MPCNFELDGFFNDAAGQFANHETDRIKDRQSHERRLNRSRKVRTGEQAAQGDRCESDQSEAIGELTGHRSHSSGIPDRTTAKSPQHESKHAQSPLRDLSARLRISLRNFFVKLVTGTTGRVTTNCAAFRVQRCAERNRGSGDRSLKVFGNESYEGRRRSRRSRNERFTTRDQLADERVASRREDRGF